MWEPLTLITGFFWGDTTHTSTRHPRISTRPLKRLAQLLFFRSRFSSDTRKRCWIQNVSTALFINFIISHSRNRNLNCLPKLSQPLQSDHEAESCRLWTVVHFSVKETEYPNTYLSSTFIKAIISRGDEGIFCICWHEDETLYENHEK